jgi:hypothetical protein
MAIIYNNSLWDLGVYFGRTVKKSCICITDSLTIYVCTWVICECVCVYVFWSIFCGYDIIPKDGQHTDKRGLYNLVWRSIVQDWTVLLV